MPGWIASSSTRHTAITAKSRRLSNARMKRELRLRLLHPTPHAMLAQVAPRELTRQLALPIGA